jgi:hypothetical protein
VKKNAEKKGFSLPIETIKKIFLEGVKTSLHTTKGHLF